MKVNEVIREGADFMGYMKEKDPEYILNKRKNKHLNQNTDGDINSEEDLSNN